MPEKGAGLTPLAFVALFATTLATAIGNTGLISVMPAVGRELGISDFLVAGIFSLSALMWAFASPYWAARSDRTGRKPFILLGLFGFFFSMIGCGLVVLAGLAGLAGPMVLFVAFLVVRSSYGVLGSASATAAQAYIAEHSEGAARVRAVAGLAGALSLGTVLGPAIAPFLIIQPAGLSAPMFLFALGGLAILLFVAVVLPRDRAGGASAVANPQPEDAASIWRDMQVRPFLIYGFIMSSAQAANTYTLGFVVIDRLGLEPTAAQGAIGAAMVVCAIAALIAQWGLIGPLGLMPRTMLRWGGGLALLGNALVLLLPGYAALVAGYAIASVGYGLGRPGYTAGASLAARSTRQGAVAGAVSSIAGASIVVPPVIAVGLYELDRAAPFVVLILFLAGLCAYAGYSPALARPRER